MNNLPLPSLPIQGPLRTLIDAIATPVEKAIATKGEQLAEVHQKEVSFLRNAGKKLTSSTQEMISQGAVVVSAGAHTISSMKQKKALPHAEIQELSKQAKVLVQTGRELTETSKSLVKEAKEKTNENLVPEQSKKLSFTSRLKIKKGLFKIVLGAIFANFSFSKSRGLSILGANIGIITARFITAKNNQERRELLDTISSSILIKKIFSVAAKKLEKSTVETLIPNIENAFSFASQTTSDIASRAHNMLPHANKIGEGIIDLCAAKANVFLSSLEIPVSPPFLTAVLSVASQFTKGAALQAGNLLRKPVLQPLDKSKGLLGMIVKATSPSQDIMKKAAGTAIATFATKTTLFLSTAQTAVTSPLIKSLFSGDSLLVKKISTQGKSYVNKKVSQASEAIEEVTAVALNRLFETKVTVLAQVKTISADIVQILKAGSKSKNAQAKKIQEIFQKHRLKNSAAAKNSTLVKSQDLGNLSDTAKEVPLLDVIEGHPPGLLLSTLVTKLEKHIVTKATDAALSRMKQAVTKRQQRTKQQP